MDEVRLDRAEFEAWLQAKEAIEIVGKAQDALCCPISKFIRATTGRYIEVYENRFEGSYGQTIGVPPEWATRFISAVDGHPAFEKIDAQDALDILATIE